MKIKRSVGERVFSVFNSIILILLCVVAIYPVLYVLFASFSEPGLLIEHNGVLLKPLGFSLESYKSVFSENRIWQGYANTVFYVIVGTAINIFMTALAAYGLSRKNVYWNKYIMKIIIFTMFFGGGLIPTYLLIQNLHMTNTRWAILIPGAISVYNFIIMRTNFASIPESLEESARIDGANDFTILFRIIMPLSLPIIMVMVLYYGVGRWNEWFNSMIYLSRRKDLQPLQLYLREILIQNDTNAMMGGGVADIDRSAVSATIKYATVMVATVPILCVYPFIQKYFVKGVMVGAVKG